MGQFLMEKSLRSGSLLSGNQQYFYKKELQSKLDVSEQEFLRLVKIIEEVMSVLGDRLFKEERRLHAYEDAMNVAEGASFDLRRFNA
jgi:hypothetical protein